MKTKMTTKIHIDVAQNSGEIIPVNHTISPKEKVVSLNIDPIVFPRVNIPHSTPDDISDVEARQNAKGGPQFILGHTEPPVIPRNETLPTTINQIPFDPNQKQKQEEFNPKWIEVRHLPGYIQSTIRSTARGIFKQFTNTPIENIKFLSTITHPKHHVEKMAAWVTRNGIRDDNAWLDLSKMHPMFNAEIAYYRTKEHDYFIVKDIGGFYLYQWEGGRGVHLENQQQKQIGG